MATPDPKALDQYRADLSEKSAVDVRVEVSRLEAEADKAWREHLERPDGSSKSLDEANTKFWSSGDRPTLKARLQIARDILKAKGGWAAPSAAEEGKKEGDALHGNGLTPFVLPGEGFVLDLPRGPKAVFVDPPADRPFSDDKTRRLVGEPPPPNYLKGEGPDLVVPPKPEPKEPEFDKPWGTPETKGLTEPGLDTGHYDDGHAWGWNTKRAAQDPGQGRWKIKDSAPAETPKSKTGKIRPRPPKKPADRATSALVPPPGTFSTTGTSGPGSTPQRPAPEAEHEDPDDPSDAYDYPGQGDPEAEDDGKQEGDANLAGPLFGPVPPDDAPAKSSPPPKGKDTPHFNVPPSKPEPDGYTWTWKPNERESSLVGPSEPEIDVVKEIPSSLLTDEGKLLKLAVGDDKQEVAPTKTNTDKPTVDGPRSVGPDGPRTKSPGKSTLSDLFDHGDTPTTDVAKDLDMTPEKGLPDGPAPVVPKVDVFKDYSGGAIPPPPDYLGGEGFPGATAPKRAARLPDLSASDGPRDQRLGCFAALFWLDAADEKDKVPLWVLRAVIVGVLLLAGYFTVNAFSGSRLPLVAEPTSAVLRSFVASDLPRIVIQQSQAPAGMTRQPDSGQKSLQTGFSGLPAVQQTLSDAGYKLGYIDHYASPVPADAQVFSGVHLFGDAAGATKGIPILANLQGTVAKAQPTAAPAFGPNATTVEAHANGFALYAVYWAMSNGLFDVVLQGRETNVSAGELRDLFDKMNTNAKAVASSPAASAAASTSTAGACDAAPDVSLTLSGGTSGTATKGCLPFRNPGAPTNPYCRLDGIPAKAGANAGVLDANVAFLVNGTRYDLELTYLATTRDANGGTLPVTLRAGAGAQATLIANRTATSSGLLFSQTAGEYSFGADGASGTIDMDFASPSGLPLHVKGNWQVAGGCPKTG